MGFGFVEFRTKEQAAVAMAALNGHTLDGHQLAIKASHKGLDAVEERKKDEKNKKAAMGRTKLIIKNLPFEATKKDVMSLFSYVSSVSFVTNYYTNMALTSLQTIRQASLHPHAQKIWFSLARFRIRRVYHV